MSWVEGAEAGPFGIHHLPYGIFTTAHTASPRVGVRIGDQVLDMRRLAAGGAVFGREVGAAFSESTLNPFMAMGPETWTAVRARLTEILTDPGYRGKYGSLLTPASQVRSRLPFEPADYVDFYSSEHHARNVGRIFRPDGEPLLPNWKHLPVGYHGRAGTVVASGTPIIRPCGQRKVDGDIEFGPSRRLDIEAEVGFVVGVGSELGTSVGTGEFDEHVFGTVLVNDWSARDLQAWEYQPLGPFLGKSFATSIGNWITPLDALARAKVPAPEQDPAPLSYLEESERYAFDLALSVSWNGTEVAKPPFAEMYWTPAQQLAHLTVNGASLRTGDLFASGTVSGPEKRQRGSFLELSWGGTEPIGLENGTKRTFLADGDTVTITATAPGPDGSTIGLAEVTGTIAPSRN